MDNVRTICLRPVDRQMMDSTCVSSPVKNSCVDRWGKDTSAWGKGEEQLKGTAGEGWGEGVGGKDRPEGEPLY